MCRSLSQAFLLKTFQEKESQKKGKGDQSLYNTRRTGHQSGTFLCCAVANRLDLDIDPTPAFFIRGEMDLESLRHLAEEP